MGLIGEKGIVDSQKSFHAFMEFSFKKRDTMQEFGGREMNKNDIEYLYIKFLKFKYIMF